LLVSAPARANDVDGPDDCLRPQPPVDFGDAPEGVLAYPGVTGQFPSCLSAGVLVGTQTSACAPISTMPGQTGFVRHQHPATDRYWLRCEPVVNPPQGIDGEADAKVNDTGAAMSACGPVGVDCVESAGVLTFGQDECYGSDDAALVVPPTFKACGPGNVNWTIPAFSCAGAAKQAYLNILMDMNQDGDWNDNFLCGGGCAYEWAVKNYQVTLSPGCNTIFVPTFRIGPNPGRGWMRITISDQQVPDDFPWNGSAGIPTQSLQNGETEDYPVVILPSETCPTYDDWGDAPEEALAYDTGVIGRFPTCALATPSGTQDTECLPPLSTMPGPSAGFVRHFASPNDQVEFWLGCGDQGAGILGVDSEHNGKMNDTGLPNSLCDPSLLVDCNEFFGVTWGQDECYGDDDAGIAGPVLKFKTCQMATVDFRTYNCKDQADAFLNILVDMNEDGDWNDNFRCSPIECAYEWAVKNVPIPLGPGCELHTSPAFRIGPRTGRGWLRITISAQPVSDDFPWDGSAGPGGDGFLLAGETEDYPVMIRPDFLGVEDEVGPDLERLALAPITPNPSRDQVLVRFTLPQTSHASLAAYDISGRKVVELLRGRLEAGEHRVSWGFTDQRGRQVPAGHYVIKLQVGDRVITRRAIRVR
jgi:hypothetical protein